MEHTGWSVETTRMLIAASRLADILPYVRVPATEYLFVVRALDMGALGIMALNSHGLKPHWSPAGYFIRRGNCSFKKDAGVSRVATPHTKV